MVMIIVVGLVSAMLFGVFSLLILMMIKKDE